MRTREAWLVLLVVPWLCGAALGAPSFRGLGLLPGSGESFLLGMSADGTTLFGYDRVPPNPDRHFLWTAGGGRVPIPALDGHLALALSGDGTTVVGYDWVNGEAFRWNQSLGVVGLGGLPGGGSYSLAYGVSHDGSTIVGEGSGVSLIPEAFRWTSPLGMVGLGGAPGATSSSAWGVSADGSVVGGVVGASLALNAFRWTQGTGLVDLGLPAGATSVAVLGVSADGRALVGLTDQNGGLDTVAFRWTAALGFELLGDLPGFAVDSRATDVNATGQIVVGIANFNAGPQAFLWDPANGIRDLQNHLEVDLGLDLTGWTLITAGNVSDDGLTIAGVGVNPDGYLESWVSVLPEPASATLLGAGGALVALLSRRRRSLATVRPAASADASRGSH